MGASSSSRTDSDLGASKTMALAFMLLILTQSQRAGQSSIQSETMRMTRSNAFSSGVKRHHPAQGRYA
jgi:hypothetical protein